MATAAQIIANRANAQLSTGPRTAEGQQASSSNAKSHGLTSRTAFVPGEDPREYELFHHAYNARYLPQNMIEQKMVSELADLEWRLRRVPEFEAQLLKVEYRKLTTDPDLLPLIAGLDSERQIVALAFQRLVESKVLPNLHHQEARLARRAEKLERLLSGDARLMRPMVHAVRKLSEQEQPTSTFNPTVTPSNENRKNEPKSAAKAVPFVKPYEPGRNESCLCGSGLKFKRCCWNKPQESFSAQDAAAAVVR